MISLIEEHQGVHRPSGLPLTGVVIGGSVSQGWWDIRPEGTLFTAEIMDKQAAIDEVEKQFRRLPPDIRVEANSKVSGQYNDRLRTVPWPVFPAVYKEILDCGLDLLRKK